MTNMTRSRTTASDSTSKNTNVWYFVPLLHHDCDIISENYISYFHTLLLSVNSVYDNAGNVVIQEVAIQPLTQDLLSSAVTTFNPFEFFFWGRLLKKIGHFTCHYLFVRTVIFWTTVGLMWWCGRAKRPQRMNVKKLWREHWYETKDNSRLNLNYVPVFIIICHLELCNWDVCIFFLTRTTLKPKTIHPAPVWRWWVREESQPCLSTCSKTGEKKGKLLDSVTPTLLER